MSSEIETLRRLQALERAAADVRARLASLPEQRDAIAETVNADERTVAFLKEQVEERQVSRRKGEGEMAAMQNRLTKYRNQLMTVTTGREYEAMQHEIATLEGQFRALEDEVLGWLMDVDDLQPRVNAAEVILVQAREAAGIALAGVAEEEQKDRLALAALEGNVQAERESLSPSALATYDRGTKRYPLSAVAELKGELCSACNVRLRPMVISDVKRGEKLIQCDSCARILAYVPPPPVPTPPDAAAGKLKA